MGDSLGRKYYFDLLAALGHPSPLAHDDTAAKHQDLRFDVDGETSVAFYWRPYAREVQAQLAQWSAGGVKSQPQAALLSFGLWDTLHETPVDEVAAAVEGIAEALRERRQAGGEGFRAWLLPTTVVDTKLLTEEKRAHMTEAQVAAMRESMKGSALPGAVDVVLDGAKVTQGLAARSEDGVHYDDGVYATLVQMGSNAYAASLKGPAAAAAAAQKQGDQGHKKQRQREQQGRRVLLGLDDVADWEVWGEEEGAGETGVGGTMHRVLKAAAGPKEIDGSMSSPWHGAFVLIVVALMLLTMDSYAGLSWLALWLTRADAKVTWVEAYEPLLSKILRAAPPSQQPSGGANSSSSISRESSSGHHHTHHSGVGGSGAAVRGRYTPVPQGEIELGGVDKPLSPGDSGPTPNEE